MIGRLAALTVILLSSTAQAEPVAVETSVMSSFASIGFGETFGPLVWRGGISLSSDDADFGGLSGLVLADDCQSLLAVSDAGRWFRATLTYADDRLSGITSAELAPILDSKGQPQRSKAWADAEAVTAAKPGQVAVAFERKVRFGIYDIGTKGLDAPFQVIPHPRDIDGGPENGEVEALGRLPSGNWIALAERGRNADGNPHGWIWSGRASTPFAVTRHDDYNITDLAVLPDGRVLTLERSFSRGSLPGMAIRRFDPAGIADGATIEPDLLFEGRVPFYRIDNMEGIAVCERRGETRVTLVSDDNFNSSLQTTLILQFAYKP